VSTALPPARFLGSIPGPGGERSTVVFEHGSLLVKLYAPRGTDPQTPHARDEVYVVVSGTGWFVHGAKRERFAPHDFLFAEAGPPHRFEGFTEGGEQPG